MVTMQLNSKFDASELETGSLVLGFKKIELLFNLGPFPGGGDCIVVRADGRIMVMNSSDIIHDLEGYELSEQ